MPQRHLSRTVAMQTLYEWDFNHRSQKLQNLVEKNFSEFGVGAEDKEFVEELVHGVTKNIGAIDEVITKNAPDWPLEKITIIDLNVLRLGIYEMMFAKQVPPKVVIDECVEMAKTFGGGSSSKFVNGVLGAVYDKIENSNP